MLLSAELQTQVFPQSQIQITQLLKVSHKNTTAPTFFANLTRKSCEPQRQYPNKLEAVVVTKIRDTKYIPWPSGDWVQVRSDREFWH